MVRVEARTMRLLLYLADRAGEVVSIDELLKEVWSGVIVTSDSVYQAVASLRRVLGDDPEQPTYIATVPRLGYRMVAPVTMATDARRTNGERADVARRRHRASSTRAPSTAPPRRRRIVLASGVAVLLTGRFGVCVTPAGGLGSAARLPRSTCG